VHLANVWARLSSNLSDSHNHIGQFSGFFFAPRCISATKGIITNCNCVYREWLLLLTANCNKWSKNADGKPNLMWWPYIDEWIIPFLYTTAETPNALQWADSPQNCPSLWGYLGLGPIYDLIHSFLGPSELVSPQMASRSDRPFFAGLTNVTNRQTDRQTYIQTFCSNKPHLAIAAI